MWINFSFNVWILWVKWHVQRPLNLINEIHPIRLWWDYGWHLPIVLLLIILLGGWKTWHLIPIKITQTSFWQCDVSLYYIWYIQYMDKELGVGNSMILHLVSLYWYSTVIIHIPPCMHPCVRHASAFTYFNLLSLSLSLRLCVLPCIRASAHNYLILKFSLSCLLHLRWCVRAGGNLFLLFSNNLG